MKSPFQKVLRLQYRNGDRERQYSQESEQVQLEGCSQDTEYAESHIKKSVEKF